MVNLILAVIFSITYAITLNLSKGIQKWGIEGVSVEVLKTGKEDPVIRKKFIAWLIGSMGTGVALLFLFVAQNFAPFSSFVPAFMGIGLLSLIVFSYYILHEKIGISEIIGTIIIMIATLIFGLFQETSNEDYELNFELFFLSTVIPLSILFFLGFWSSKHNFKGHEFIWGSLAGFFAGIGNVFANIADIGEGINSFGISMVFFTLLSGQGAFWFTQYGFKHGQASIVVTLYNTLMLLIPIFIDIVVLGFDIPPMQLLMLIFICSGVILLTAFRKNPTKVDEKQISE
ncbi:MAG: hypothetical protein GY870_08495 [archaeon]|nr:hypothetical protein [archaeon]